MNEMREAFEKWAVEEGYDITRYNVTGVGLEACDPDYKNNFTEHAWEAWQAASSRCADDDVAAEHLAIAKKRLNAIVGDGNNILPLISRVEAMHKRLASAESEVARLKALLYEAVVELSYVHSVENCNSGLCTTPVGEEIVERGMKLLGVADLSAEKFSDAAALTVGETRKEEAQ